MEYFARSPHKGNLAQTYQEHIQAVKKLAKDFADNVAQYNQNDGALLASLAQAAAFWHDLGKLDPENQAVLSGNVKKKSLPRKHWDAGAAFLHKHNPLAMAAVYSHHGGYNDFSEEANRGDKIFRVKDEIENTSARLDDYVRTHQALLGSMKELQSNAPKGNKNVFLRILLSCLADADHTDAGIFNNNAEPYEVVNLRADERLEKLNEYIHGLSIKAQDDERASLRGEMYASCRDSNVDKAVGISSCDSPVGSGKTTAVMAHLLTQAQKRGLRRVFVVLPYTNIIRQSVKTYRKALVLPGENENNVVAELHHRADFESLESRRFASLWRAPIIVTTAVAFFETLAANSPAALRRLHELPGSAIFVDEAHAALPAKLLPITWHWMNVYSKEWGCYWVLASGSLCRFWKIPEIKQDMANKNIPEITNENLRKRLSVYEDNRVTYMSDLSYRDVDSVIEMVKSKPGPRLVILNTVNNAAVIASEYVKRFGVKSAEHLSTALTPVDRDKTLSRVESRLKDPNDLDWVLFATSCVEAGVDISFRTGFRELGSLASLLQAAGRVNREGKNKDAEMWTFVLEGDATNKNPSVKDAAEVLSEYFRAGTQISPELCTDAISNEILLQGQSGIYKELIKAEKEMGFKTVEENFSIIESDTRLVVVSDDVAERVRNGELDWRELQRHSVQIQANKLAKLKIPLVTEGINIYRWTLKYDDFIGYMAGELLSDNPEDFIL